jgi:tRNA-modifying protein YgfZ
MDSATLTDVIEGFEALCGTGGSAPVTRDVVTVSGPEAGRYLQGQLSQDVVVLAVGASAWSLLLQPTGKVDAWLRVHRTGDEAYALDVDAGWGETVIARLRRFLLRTKAQIGEVEAREVLSVRHAPTRVEIGAEPPGGTEGRLAGVVAGPSVAGVDWILPLGASAAD